MNENLRSPENLHVSELKARIDHMLTSAYTLSIWNESYRTFTPGLEQTHDAPEKLQRTAVIRVSREGNQSPRYCVRFFSPDTSEEGAVEEYSYDQGELRLRRLTIRDEAMRQYSRSKGPVSQRLLESLDGTLLEDQEREEAFEMLVDVLAYLQEQNQ